MILQNILFIGGGNMTRAIVGGLIKNQPPKTISVFDRHSAKLDLLSTDFGINTSTVLSADLLNVDVILLSIKPQSAKEICHQLKSLFYPKKMLIISIMAGIDIMTLTKWLGEDAQIVRAMPNTPALIGEGATGLFASDNVSQLQKNQTAALMKSVGIIAWLENENQIDAITALSGSGPAYFFYLMEAMKIAAENLGLSQGIAKEFAVQTAYGAAKLAHHSNHTPTILREQVTSKGGTTEAALSVFHNADFLSIVEKAMRAAFDASKRLARSHDS